jgi:alpha-L-fucosidase
MNRRRFLVSGSGTAIAAACCLRGQSATGGFPPGVLAPDSYIEPTPVPGYAHASRSAYEAFEDMKFGIRIHWGIYSIWHRGAESWPFLKMPFADRQQYNNLYKTWNPARFDADAWMNMIQESGMKMLAFTTKHHEGFSMWDTNTRVKSRANWTAEGGPRVEDCDLAYSISETPFRRDVVKELCHAAHRKGIRIDLYFSHPDWYDADFRPYNAHPLQVPSSAELMIPQDLKRAHGLYGDRPVIVQDPTAAEVKRMMERHRAQLVELLTRYGTIDMVCLDMFLGPSVWPELRKTVLKMRELAPDVMLRNRGIGNYGDYYTPERAIPQSVSISAKPWFCIYPLGTDFSYDPVAANYKGTKWIILSLIDTVAKGGGLMIGVGPSAAGEFHPEAVSQMKAAGQWLKVNGEAIFATRARDGDAWSESGNVFYTRSKDGRFVYAILTSWPGAEVSLGRVRAKSGSQVNLLGLAKSLEWQPSETKGMTVRFPENLQQPANRPCDYAWTLKIEPA